MKVTLSEQEIREAIQIYVVNRFDVKLEAIKIKCEPDRDYGDHLITAEIDLSKY